jgi:hypothetical protein
MKRDYAAQSGDTEIRHVVSASREIASGAKIFELIADPAQQP